MNLNGYKTYILAACLAIWAITGLVLGKVDVNTAVTEILAALTAAGLRHGITAKSPV